MKKKLLIELFIYVTIVIVGLILLFTYKPKQKSIDIPSDYKIERSDSSAFVSFKQ
ncbi:hypothetical protein [Clostridium niameyense]|uniref:hypothetical protein n=1 Tax=Clostridium niameyense TaxID=1622073 RepID=UPI000A80A6D6|nr:hypothetical protein [Clostridium niameyense]